MTRRVLGAVWTVRGILDNPLFSLGHSRQVPNLWGILALPQVFWGILEDNSHFSLDKIWHTCWFSWSCAVHSHWAETGGGSMGLAKLAFVNSAVVRNNGGVDLLIELRALADAACCTAGPTEANVTGQAKPSQRPPRCGPCDIGSRTSAACPVRGAFSARDLTAFLFFLSTPGLRCRLPHSVLHASCAG